MVDRQKEVEHHRTYEGQFHLAWAYGFESQRKDESIHGKLGEPGSDIEAILKVNHENTDTVEACAMVNDANSPKPVITPVTTAP